MAGPRELREQRNMPIMSTRDRDFSVKTDRGGGCLLAGFWEEVISLQLGMLGGQGERPTLSR